jgi:hypothetical protein
VLGNTTPIADRSQWKDATQATNKTAVAATKIARDAVRAISLGERRRKRMSAANAIAPTLARGLSSITANS